jgi:hypothetical protein
LTLNKTHWMIAILIVVAAAGRFWLIAGASARDWHVGSSSELVRVRGQVQEWMAAWDSRQTRVSDFTVDPSAMRGLPSALAQTWVSIADPGVTQISLQRLDPEAVVLVRAGPDGQPGVAGIDDNGNGIVDDTSELGATGSDDICRAERAEESVSEPGQQTLILQRGAYIPATDVQAARGNHPSRAIVVGKSIDGQPWSFMVEGNSEFGE